MHRSFFPVFSGFESALPFVVRSAGYSADQDRVTRPGGYPYHHILFSANGSGSLRIKNTIFELTENTGFFCYPGVEHEYYALTKTWETIWLTFDGYGVLPILMSAGIDEFKIIRSGDSLKLIDIIYKIMNCLVPDNVGKGYTSSMLLYEFMLEFVKCFPTVTDYADRIGSVISYIDGKYQNDLSLEEISSVLGVTPRHLCRLFRQYKGQTLSEYIMSKRIQKAKELLVSSKDKKIDEISQIAGYHNTSYFCKRFKNAEGITPAQFRKMY